jgi:CRISPR/Cas system-associated exonuclease Cas4 (RecB family)
LILQAIAAGAERVTTDYLIESDLLAVDRQEWSLSDAQVEMARERVKAAVKAIEAGVFLPADASDWRCVSCPLRPCCRYV